MIKNEETKQRMKEERRHNVQLGEGYAMCCSHILQWEYGKNIYQGGFYKKWGFKLRGQYGQY